MAGQRIELMELRQLLQLKQAGTSNRKTAELLHVSRNTVNTYVAEFKAHALNFKELLALNDKELSELFPSADYKDIDRYKQLTAHFPDFAKELTKPGCTLQTLWHTYLDQYPQGYRYTQFTQYFRQWRHRQKPSGILTHKAGEQLFVDYTGKLIPYVDRNTGELKEAQVFVAILPCSQYTYVKAAKSQKREDFIDGLNSCLHWMGGVPKAIVTDNLKSAVIKAHRYAPEINKTLRNFALHYNCVIDPTRPYRPKDKAMVEGAVKLVYQRIFYPLSKQTFFSIDEINRAIEPLLEKYNRYSFQHANTTREQRFLELEKNVLKTLPAHPYVLRSYRQAKVQKICHILLSDDKNYYSVPHRYIGLQVEVQYNKDIVEIFYNQERIATHRRSLRKGNYATQKDHMPPGHQVFTNWNPSDFQARALKIGKHVKIYIARLFEQYEYPQHACKQAQGILAFKKQYPPERIENACKRALDHPKASYKTIAAILKNNADQLENEQDHTANEIEPHENIRGRQEYA